MAKQVLHLKSKHTGQMKKAPVGYSWTMLLFNFFVPMLRGDWKWAAITFILSLIFIVTLLSAGVKAAHALPVTFILGFVYNKIYIKNLINKGYEVSSVEGGEVSEVESKLKLTLPLSK